MELAMATATRTDILADKLRSAGVIVEDRYGPRFDPDRIELLLDELERVQAALPKYVFVHPMPTPPEPIPAAVLQQRRPSADYFELKEEVWLLLNRIMIEGGFLGDVVPLNIGWTHVASLAHIRSQLREVNDQLFAEGSYAP